MNEIRFLYFDRTRWGHREDTQCADSEYELTTQSSQLDPIPYPQGRGEKNQPGATLMSIRLKSGGGVYTSESQTIKLIGNINTTQITIKLGLFLDSLTTEATV